MKFVSCDLKHRGMMPDAIRELMGRAVVGRMATINPDGTPYIVPLNFVLVDDRIFLHCGMEGKKLENIRSNPAVCFEVDEVIELSIVPEKPCKSDTYYRSVIASGKAAVVEDPGKKTNALYALMDKYSGGRAIGEMPMEVVEKTSVIEIVIEEISGKALYP